ncbi:MAG: hypothetical protein ACTIH2_02535 [Anaerococcus sp.]
MRKTNMRNKRKVKFYNKKINISSFLWFLSGLGVLSFGIYFMEIFEIIGGSLLIIFSLIQYAEKNRRKTIETLKKKERNKLTFLSVIILVFSLINPIGIFPAIYDLYKREWVMRGGLDE